MTGLDHVTMAGETFTLTTRVRHLGGFDLPDLAATLTTFEKGAAYTLVSEATQAVPLNAGEEATLAWTIRYDGMLQDDQGIFEITLADTGERDVTFNSNSLDVPVLVDPTQWDRDLDTMPDHWETQYGLDPTREDGDEDLDNDGAVNRVEFARQLRPDFPDTDGDGLSDGEELFGGADGWTSDPLVADTDGDGLLDSVDPNPTVADLADPTPPAEPAVALATNRLFLSPSFPIATVAVSNAGEGELAWAATSSDESLIQVSVERDDPAAGDGTLTISLAPEMMTALLTDQIVTVEVADMLGLDPDTQAINVIVSNDLQRTFQDVDLSPQDTWRFSFWFGFYDRESGPPWWYHLEHGWIYPETVETGEIYYFDPGLDSWVLTTAELYPWIYLYREIPGISPEWIWYRPGGTPGAREFYTADRARIEGLQ